MQEYFPNYAPLTHADKLPAGLVSAGDEPRDIQADPTSAPTWDLEGKSKDRYIFAEALRRGWQVDPAVKAAGFECVRKVLERERAKENPNSRVLKSCMAVVMAEQRMALEDLHHIERLEGGRQERQEHYRRVDAGLATESHELHVKGLVGIDVEAL